MIQNNNYNTATYIHIRDIPILGEIFEDCPFEEGINMDFQQQYDYPETDKYRLVLISPESTMNIIKNSKSLSKKLKKQIITELQLLHDENVGIELEMNG